MESKEASLDPPVQAAEVPIGSGEKLHKKFGTDILASFSGEIFLFLAALLLGILTARFLGADGKGRFNVIYYAVGLLSTICSLRFQIAITYYLSKKKELLGEVVVTGLIVGVFATGGVLLFTTAFPQFFKQYLVRGIEVQIYVLGLLGASVFLWSLIIALLAGLQHFRTRAIFMGSSYVLKSVQVIVSLGLFHQDLNGLLMTMGMVEVAVYAIVIVYLLRGVKVYRVNLTAFVEMLKYAVASFPGTISDLITLRIDVFFVNFFSGASQVGLYTVSISIANMLLYIPTAVKSVLMPFIASQGSREITPGLSRLLILILSILSVGLIPVVWIGLIPFYGVEFGFSRFLFLVLLPGSICWAIFSLLSADLEGRGLPWKASTISMATAATTILLDMILIPSSGALGAALASTISYALAMLLAVILYRRITGVRVGSMLFPRGEDIRLVIHFASQLLARARETRTNYDPER